MFLPNSNASYYQGPGHLVSIFIRQKTCNTFFEVSGRRVAIITQTRIYRSPLIIQIKYHFYARNLVFKICNLTWHKVNNMNPMFCDCCGDAVKATYKCKFIFYDGLKCDINICPECMNNGTLEINLKRKRCAAQILFRLAKVKTRA